MLPTRVFRLIVAALVAALLLLGMPGTAEAGTSRALSITPSPVKALKGTTVTFSGKLTRSPKGTPLVVQRKVGSRWSTVKSTKTTSSAGAYSVKIARPSTAGVYYYRAYAARRGSLNAATSRSVSIVAQNKVAVTLALNPTSVVEGVATTVTLSGKASPFASGAKVTIQRQSGASWVAVKTATLSSTGAYTTTVAVTTSTATAYRVSVPAGGTRAAGVSPVRTLAVTPVVPVIETTSLPDGVQGTPYNADLEAVGDPAGTWTVTNLPAGLSYVASTGVIGGTPTASGTSSVAIGFTQTANGASAVPKNLDLEIAPPPPPVIETTALPDGLQGTAYSADLEAVGDPAGTWTVTGLPAGLSYVASTGVISGTPTAAATTNVTIGFTQTSTGLAATGKVLPLRVDAVATTPAQVKLSAGGQHGCRVNTDRTVDCWGYNFSEQIGQPLVLATPYNATPTQVGAASDWVEVSAGGSSNWAHSCGIRGDRSLWCWGSNVDGELGQPGTGAYDIPQKVDVGRNWATVSAGFAHTCAVTTGGELWCFGSDTFGQLGRTGDAAPARVGSRSDWKSVSAGYTHTCATTTGGELWCWGFNPRGQLGNGSTADSDVPVREASNGTTWASVSVSAGTSCALRTNATLWCWGYNAHGETGTGNAGTDRLVPTQVGSATDWESVSATGASGQGNHACAINTGGELWCWGYNISGETGADPGTNVLVPTRIGTGTDWASVATGGNMTYAAKDDGSQWSWGANGYGQLGRGFADAGGKTPVAILP